MRRCAPRRASPSPTCSRAAKSPAACRAATVWAATRSPTSSCSAASPEPRRWRTPKRRRFDYALRFASAVKKVGVRARASAFSRSALLSRGGARELQPSQLRLLRNGAKRLVADVGGIVDGRGSAKKRSQSFGDVDEALVQFTICGSVHQRHPFQVRWFARGII